MREGGLGKGCSLHLLNGIFVGVCCTFSRHFSLELYATLKEKMASLNRSRKCRHSGLLAEAGPLDKALREGPGYPRVINRTDSSSELPNGGLQPFSALVCDEQERQRVLEEGRIQALGLGTRGI